MFLPNGFLLVYVSAIAHRCFLLMHIIGPTKLRKCFFFPPLSFLFCDTGLQAERLLHRHPGPSATHRRGLLENGVGVEMSLHCHAHWAPGEGAGKPWWPMTASNPWLTASITTTAVQHKPPLLWFPASVTKLYSYVSQSLHRVSFFEPKLLMSISISRFKLHSVPFSPLFLFLFFFQDKCCQYWPTEESVTYGDYTVELKGDTLCDTFSLRDLVLTFVPVGKLTFTMTELLSRQ